MPRTTEWLSYSEYRSICTDTAYANDTIETVNFVQRGRKTVETRREIKIYSNRQLIRSRTYANSTWTDFYYTYDLRGRLTKREKRDAAGTLISCVYITFSGDTVRCSSSNGTTNYTSEAVTDTLGILRQERTLHNGQCQGWEKYESADENYLHSLFIINCDPTSGIATGTIEHIFSNDTAGITSCQFFAYGKVYRTDIARFDSLHRYTKIERKTEAGHDSKKAHTTTEIFTRYEACADFLEKTEVTVAYSNSRKTEERCTIRRKVKWPEH